MKFRSFSGDSSLKTIFCLNQGLMSTETSCWGREGVCPDLSIIFHLIIAKIFILRLPIEKLEKFTCIPIQEFRIVVALGKHKNIHSLALASNSQFYHKGQSTVCLYHFVNRARYEFLASKQINKA